MRLLALAAALVATACATLTPAQQTARALEDAQRFKSEAEYARAATHYERALAGDPTNLVALRGLVEMHHRLGRLSELERRFEAQVEATPGDAYAHEGLGLTRFAQGGVQLERAHEPLRRAAELEPKVADLHYRLGLFLVEADRYDEARTALARAVELDPSPASYRLPYSVALARTGDRSGAVAQLAAVLRLNPTRAELDRAERTARALLDPFRGFPEPAREQFELAMQWMQSEQPVQARGILESLLERYPDLAVLHSFYGLCTLRLDDAGRAIAAFRKAMELDPDLAEPRQYLGDLYFARGRPDNAREHYEAALVRNPFLADAHKRLGEVLLKDGDRAEALERFDAYLLLRPGDFELHLARVALLTEMNRPEAAPAWDRLVEQFPRKPEALVGRGRFYIQRAIVSKSGDERARSRREAQRSLEAAVALDPENVAATALLAELRHVRI